MSSSQFKVRWNALSYGSNTVTDPRSELGVRANKSFALTDAVSRCAAG